MKAILMLAAGLLLSGCATTGPDYAITYDSVLGLEIKVRAPAAQQPRPTK